MTSLEFIEIMASLISIFGLIYSGAKLLLNKKNNELVYKTNYDSAGNTTITIWNSGKNPILREHIQNKNHLKIKCRQGIQFNKLQFLYVTSTSNELALLPSSDNTFALIDFKFLNPNDGMVIKITHNGKYSQNIIIEGDIIGVNEIKSVEIPTFRYGHITSFIVFFVLTIGNIVVPLTPTIPFDYDREKMALLWAIVGFFGILEALFDARNKRDYPPKLYKYLEKGIKT